jgi:hypothetical protein
VTTIAKYLKDEIINQGSCWFFKDFEIIETSSSLILIVFQIVFKQNWRFFDSEIWKNTRTNDSLKIANFLHKSI